MDVREKMAEIEYYVLLRVDKVVRKVVENETSC